MNNDTMNEIWQRGTYHAAIKALAKVAFNKTAK
jgi:hypothetical protein